MGSILHRSQLVRLQFVGVVEALIHHDRGPMADTGRACQGRGVPAPLFGRADGEASRAMAGQDVLVDSKHIPLNY
jgi:hypothetical protein